MLVLTRRQGESIVVGQNIVITVVEIKGGQVRIGISAPRDVQVHRQEIFEQVRAENVAAVASARVARDALAKQQKGDA
jgi:carbon storage regulator